MNYFESFDNMVQSTLEEKGVVNLSITKADEGIHIGCFIYGRYFSVKAIDGEVWGAMGQLIASINGVINNDLINKNLKGVDAPQVDNA